MPTASSTSLVDQPRSRDFTLGARTEHRTDAEANAYFDRYHRADGIDFAALSAEEQSSYTTARTAYARVCKGARRNRKTLARRDKAAHDWAARQVGPAGWVPEWVFVAAGVPTPQPTATVPVCSPREPGAAPRRRRGAAANRGGDSGDGSRRSADDDEPHPPDVAWPDRAPQPWRRPV